MLGSKREAMKYENIFQESYFQILLLEHILHFLKTTSNEKYFELRKKTALP